MSYMIPSLDQTKRSFDEALHYAAMCAAFKSNINNPEFYNIEELFAEIGKISQPLFLALKELRQQHNNLLAFYQDVEDSGGGGISAQQSQNQVQVYLELDAARTSLINTLRNV